MQEGWAISAQKKPTSHELDMECITGNRPAPNGPVIRYELLMRMGRPSIAVCRPETPEVTFYHGHWPET